jgi:hypothetical protein
VRQLRARVEGEWTGGEFVWPDPGGCAFTPADLIAAALSWFLGRTSDDERNSKAMQLLRSGRG